MPLVLSGLYYTNERKKNTTWFLNKHNMTMKKQTRLRATLQFKGSQSYKTQSFGKNRAREKETGFMEVNSLWKLS